jgi:N-methylhydantoinase A
VPSSKSAKQNTRRVRVGVDTGGTFTDFVYVLRDGRTGMFKVASTPADPARAITEGLRRIASESKVALGELEIVHGTTVGTNALLERRGARAALVTTKGFEDVLAIGRQARPALYNLDATRPDAIIPRALRFGVGERIAATGEVLEALDESALVELVEKLKRERVESVGISLLFSFLHPAHERMIARALSELGVPLSVSHEILPEYREFERTSTVAINAYLQPLMGAYLKRLSSRRLRVMQSSGGSISAQAASREPVRTILSGPAGGVVGALRAASAVGSQDIVTFDMGGTSTDVALCAGGEMLTTNEATVAALPVAVPVLDIHTVGAGGGSIARVDAGGSLRVGPESAGAEPGPAAYGRGHLPTVTDANLVLGRFGGAQLLGGDFKLDAERARDVLEQLAREMSAASGRRLTAHEAALGVVRVVNAGMERALRVVSIERGYDSRSFALVSFGGAGGLHAVALAESLRIPRVIVPQRPGALSALGALTSDVVMDSSRTVMLDTTTAAAGGRQVDLEGAFQAMERAARAALRREGFSDERQRHVRSVSARYRGQSFELEINPKSARTLAAAFHRAHLARYGYAQKENAVEIVTARLRSRGLVEKLKRERIARSANSSHVEPKAVATTTTALVYFKTKPERVALYAREELKAGARLQTPCIVTEYSSTTLIPEAARAHVDQEGNLIIELGKS